MLVQNQGRFIMGLLVPLGAGLLYGLWYLKRSGLFKRAAVVEKVFGPYLLVYKNHVGVYSGVGKVFDEMISRCSLLGWDRFRGKAFGAYFDDPSTVEAKKCRSSIGVVWAENRSIQELEKMKQELLAYPQFQQSGLKVALYPRSWTYSVDFPMTGYLSIFLAISRSYPALDKYLKTQQSKCQGGGSFELYDHEKQIMECGFPTTERSELLPFDR